VREPVEWGWLVFATFVFLVGAALLWYALEAVNTW